MAQKVFRQFFNTFKGVHERFTHITRPLEYAAKCQNLILDTSNNLVTRNGFRRFVPGATDYLGYNSLSSSTLDLPKYGLHAHRYQALDGSGQIEEIIGIGNHVFRLKAATFSALYTGATTGLLSWYYDESGGNAVRLEIQDDLGTAITSYLPEIDTGSIPLGLVKDTIEARANWSVTISGYAKVNGAQVARDFNNPITVDAGHTISIATDKATMMAYYSTNGTPDLGYEFTSVVETTATTVRPKQKAPSAVIDLADNAYLGTGLLDAMCLPFFRQANCRITSPGYTVTFYYWERVPWGSDRDFGNDVLPFPTSWLMSPKLTSTSRANRIRYFPGAPEFQNYKCVSYDNAVYIAAQGQIGIKKKASSSALDIEVKSGLIQYDGQSYHQAAMPSAYGSVAVGGAGLLNGTYKYIYRHKCIDFQGYEHFGADTIQVRGSPYSVAPAGNVVNITIGNMSSIGDDLRFPYRINYVSGNQVLTAGASVNILVDGSTATRRQLGLYVGDVAAFLDRSTGSFGQIVKATVNSIAYVSATTYNLNVNLPTNCTVNNGDYITNNFTTEIYRTEAGNNTFYYLAEIPFEAGGVNTYADNTASVSSNAAYDGPFTGTLRRDPAPQLSVLEVHQGLLVGAGDPDVSNSLYWCNTDDAWAWSSSTNQTTVVPPGGGGITTIASSDDNSLAVFGEKGVSFISGDFATVSINEISRFEGDVGCPSRHGAVKINDELWWLSNVGLRSATGSRLNPATENFVKTISGKDYSLVFNGLISSANKLKPLAKKAVAYNYADRQIALWVVPALQNIAADEKVIAPSSSTTTLYFDYQNGFFGTWRHNEPYIYGVGGLSSQNGKILQLGQYFNDSVPFLSGVLFRELGEYTATLPDRVLENFYDDYIIWIRNDLTLAYDTTGDPSVDKQFLRFKVYSEHPDPSSFLQWIAYISTNKNFVLTGGTQNVAMTFSSASQYEQVIKLFSEKARAMQFRLSNTTGINRMVLTGIEYEVALAYKPEEVQKT